MQIWKYVEDHSANPQEPDGECHRLIRTLLREVLQLPSESVWHAGICIMCYLTVMGHVLLSANGRCITEYKDFSLATIFYIIDFVLLIDTVLTAIGIYYLSKHPEIRAARRPIGLLVIEFFSVLPFELVSREPNVHCTLTLNRSLRIILIIYFNTKRCQRISSGILFSRLVEFCSYMLFLTLVSFGIYCNYRCHQTSECSMAICYDYNLGGISSMVSSVGYAYIPTDTLFRMISIIAQMTVFFFISIAATAHFSVAYVSRFYNQMNYSSCTLGMIAFLKRLNVPKYLLARINEEFHLVWSMRRTKCYNLSREGCDTGTSFLHPSMYNELMIDIAWVSFKHSHLFRRTDFHYLRYLANYVSLEYKLPGEYIYTKGEWKNKLVYVSSGTIEILSNEDLQSSILSLCEGTLVGACTLMLSYRSSHCIRCKTFCEFHVLKKSDFIRSSALFPDEFKKIKDQLVQRFNDTRAFQDVAVRAKKTIARKRESVDPYTLLWVKNTLHRLMAKDADSTYRHEFQNIYLITEVQVEEFNRLLFHAEYLDMLVVKERLQVDMDSVFVRTQFPFVFQPDSIFGIAWDGIVTALTVIMAFTIPYVAFVKQKMPEWYSWLVIGGSHVYLLDVLIQLSTAMKSRHGVTVTFSATVKARIQTMAFWMDVGALVPAEAFICILSTVVKNGIRARLQLNRLLKIYRIKVLFDRWDQQFNANKLTIRYVKYFFVIAYTIFLVYCLLTYRCRYQVSYNLDYVATLVVTKAFFYTDFAPPYFYHPSINLFVEVLIILLFSNIMSGFVMENLSKFQSQDMYACVIKVLGTNDMAQKYGGRILRIMELEWEENRCQRLQPQEKVVCRMSDATYGEFVSSKVAEVLKTIECFRDFSDDLIYDICEILHVQTMPPNEPIAYGGDLVGAIIFVHKGTYNVFNEYGEYSRTKNTPVMINLLEAMMRIPTVNTFTSVTSCRLFCMEADRFRSVLTKHSYCSETFLSILRGSIDIRAKMMKLSKKNLYFANLQNRITAPQTPEFYVFKNLVKHTYAEYDYFVPFDRLYPFFFIRYFFMRKTIDPGGRFMTAWEILRCTCAILTGTLSFFIPITASAGEVLLVLDIAALADIYVRLHVAYYNKDGILVSHPLATAKHYLRGAFAVDFIGMYPTILLAIPSKGLWNVMLRLNKLLQMYRYLAFFNMVVQHKITPVSRAYGLTFIPIILVFGAFCSAVITTLQCDVDSSNGTVILNCAQGNAFEAANITTPINALQAQLFAIYMACSMLTTAGIQGFVVPTEVRTFVAMISVAGLFLTVTFAGRFIALYSFTHGTLLKYQNNIRSLLVHLRCLNVRPDLQKKVIANYEMKWRIIRTREVTDFLGRVSMPLKQDVLYDLYGTRLFNTSVFVTREVGFYRNLLPYLQYDVIDEGGFLGKTNDIASDLYIIYNGEVGVLSPNGGLEETLYPGSIFGNMNNRERIRYYTSYKAISYVEFLHVPAKRFFKLLDYYPQTAREYNCLRSIQLRYIAAKKSILKKPIESSPNLKSAKSVVFRQNTKRMEAWQLFVLTFVCFFGTILNLYQLGVQEYSYTMLGILYFFDVAYAVHYFIKSRTAYTDSRGTYITDLNMIRKRWKANRVAYAMRIISLIPFEIPFLFMYNLDHSTRYLLFGLARCNRYYRLTLIFIYFTQKTYKLNVNVYLMRLGYIFMWTYLVLTATATAIILPGSLEGDAQNVSPPIPYYKDIYGMNSSEKFQLYIVYLHLAANLINFRPQGSVHPTSVKYTVLFVIILVLSMLLMYLCYSQIYSLIDQCSFYQVKYRDILNRLDNFMKREDVSIALYDRIVNYVQKRWEKRGTDVYPALMDGTPLYLQEEIKMSVFGHIIATHNIFLNVHRDLLRQIAGKIRSRIFYNGDYIQFEGVNDQCMYFILTGEVNAVTDFGRVIATIRSGELFGLLQGLDPKKKHEHTYVANKNSMIGILNASSWKFLLEFFPLDKVRIHSAANQYAERS